MIRQINIDVKKELYDKATEIMNEIGVDFEDTVSILLKRIVKDRSILFLLSNNGTGSPVNEQSETETESSLPVNSANGSITKNKAVQLFKARGFDIARKVTFSSKNRGAYFYWANPVFEVLDNDWTLILNDMNTKILYLFHIPARSIARSSLVARSDRPELIDMQITYDDITFTEKRSRFSFREYFIAKIGY